MGTTYQHWQYHYASKLCLKSPALAVMERQEEHHHKTRQMALELWYVAQHHRTVRACSAFLSCRFQFADMDQNVFKEMRIKDLPPPEGMKINEFRCAHSAS